MVGKQGATLGFLSTSWVGYLENAVCAPLFCSARDIVCIYIFSVVLALQSPLAQ